MDGGVRVDVGNAGQWSKSREADVRGESSYHVRRFDATIKDSFAAETGFTNHVNGG